MQNTIEINPVDVDVRIRANSVKIWNEFKNLGLVKRAAFVSVVQQLDPNYLEYEKEKLLGRFWNGRMYSQFINDDLEKVLDRLKAE